MPLITALAGSQGSECGISLNNQDCRIKTRRQEQRGHAAAICAAAVVGGSGRGGCAGGARPPAPRAPSPRLCHGHPAPDAGSWGNGSQKIPEQPPPGLGRAPLRPNLVPARGSGRLLWPLCFWRLSSCDKARGLPPKECHRGCHRVSPGVTALRALTGIW